MARCTHCGQRLEDVASMHGSERCPLCPDMDTEKDTGGMPPGGYEQ